MDTKEKIDALMDLCIRKEKVIKKCNLISNTYYLTFVKDEKDEDGNVIGVTEAPADLISELRDTLTDYHKEIYEIFRSKLDKCDKMIENVIEGKETFVK